MAIAEDKKALDKWDEFIRSLQRAAVVDVNEGHEQKLARIGDVAGQRQRGTMV